MAIPYLFFAAGDCMGKLTNTEQIMAAVAGQRGGANMSLFKWTEDDQTLLDADAVLELRSSDNATDAAMRPFEELEPQSLGDFVPRAVGVSIDAPAELVITDTSVGWGATQVSPQQVLMERTDTTSDDIADIFQRIGIVRTSVEHEAEHLINVTVRGDNAIFTPLPPDYQGAFRSFPIDDTHVRILYIRPELTFQTSYLEATVDLTTGEVTPGLVLIDRSTAEGTMLGAEGDTLADIFGSYSSFVVDSSATKIINARTIVCSVLMATALRYRFIIFDLVDQSYTIMGDVGPVPAVANPWFVIAAESAQARWFVAFRSTDDEDLYVYAIPIQTDGKADHENVVVSELAVTKHGAYFTGGDAYSLLTVDDSDPDPLLHKLYFRVGAEQNISTPNSRYVYGAAGSPLSVTGVLPEQSFSRYVGRVLVADSYGVQFGLPWAHRIGEFSTNFVSRYVSHADFASLDAEQLLDTDTPLVDGVPPGPLRDTFAQILQTVDIDDVDDPNLTLLPVRVHKLSENETEVRLLIVCTAMGNEPFWNYSLAAIATRTKGPDSVYTSCVPFSSVGVQNYSNYAANGSFSVGPPDSNMVSTLGSNALLNLYLEPSTLTRRVRILIDDEDEDDDANDELLKSNTSDQSDEKSTSTKDLLWWHWLLISMGIVITLGVIGVLLYFKLRPPLPPTPQPSGTIRAT